MNKYLRILNFLTNWYRCFVDRHIARIKNYRTSIKLTVNLNNLNKKKKLLLEIVHVNGNFIPEIILSNLNYWEGNEFETISIITYSNVSLEDLKKTCETVFKKYSYIIRGNKGKDFGGLADVIRIIDVDKYEEILIMNDSLIGPLYYSDIYEQLYEKDADVVGATESYDRAYHLQSSLVLFKNKKSVEKLRQFFINEYKLYEERENIVIFGEVGLSQYLIRHGVRIKSLHSMLDLCADSVRWLENKRLVNINPQHVFGEKMFIEMKFPYIKRELIAKNPLKLDLNYEAILETMDESSKELLVESLMSRT